MDRKKLLQEMRDCVGTQNPVVFFEKMIDVFALLFDRIDGLEAELKETRMNATLAIQWEPRVAQAMLTAQINILREDKDTYFDEISKLMQAFKEDKVTQDYSTFCTFWQETLGFHPFLNYK